MEGRESTFGSLKSTRRSQPPALSSANSGSSAPSFFSGDRTGGLSVRMMWGGEGKRGIPDLTDTCAMIMPACLPSCGAQAQAQGLNPRGIRPVAGHLCAVRCLGTRENGITRILNEGSLVENTTSPISLVTVKVWFFHTAEITLAFEYLHDVIKPRTCLGSTAPTANGFRTRFYRDDPKTRDHATLAPSPTATATATAPSVSIDDNVRYGSPQPPR